jgi:hypothetical protein
VRDLQPGGDAANACHIGLHDRASLALQVFAEVSRGREEQALPDRLDMHGVASDQARGEVVPDQRHDRRAAGADGVAVACADEAVRGVDADHRGLLRDEGLDRVGAHHLRRKVDLQDFNARDFRHEARSATARMLA